MPEHSGAAASPHMPGAAPVTGGARSVAVILVGLATFSVLFVVIDQLYVGFVDAHFPPVGTSAALATLYGLVSRLHLIVPLTVVALWRPRELGFQVGRIREHRRLLTVFLLANCGIVGGYLLLAGPTPYGGTEWLVTEVVTVPLVEETAWRGLVFAALLAALRRSGPEARAVTISVWASGIAFGLAHAANALVGLPVEFVAVQVLNAAVWGVVYGYARAVSDSIYPPIALHAAMNLVVVLLS
ncbi:MAG: CPBP family intramembrane glutamic endopeptidase [Dermatophilaceae bacterium]